MPEPKVISIVFINETGMYPLTAGQRNLYPQGEQGYWVNNQERAHFVYIIKNTGTAGPCYIRFETYGFEQHWEGTLAQNEERTFTSAQFLASSRDGSGEGTSKFSVICMDETVNPYRWTDQVNVSIISINGFSIRAFIDSTRITASGRITGSGLDTPYTTTPTADAVIHVGRYVDTKNVDFTITCTDPTTNVTKTTVSKPLMSYPFSVIEFRFGTYVPPNIVITRLILHDVRSNTDFDILAGQTPSLTFGGTRYYSFTVRNDGGDCLKTGLWTGVFAEVLGLVTVYIATDLLAGQEWSDNAGYIFNSAQNNFTEKFSVGYDIGNNKTTTNYRDISIIMSTYDTFPYPDDSWCETGLTTPDGQAWSQWEGQLALDNSISKVGAASIRYDLPNGYSHLRFDMINGQIFCDTYVWFCFMIRCSDHTKLQGLYQVELKDSAGRKASIIDHVLMSNEFVARAFPVGTGSMIFWNAPADFDWNAVKSVTFYFQTSNPITIWIDNMHFRVGNIVSHNVYVTVKDTTGQPIPNITCMLGGYFDSIKWTYGSAVGKTDSAGNATIANIAVTDWQGIPIPSSYYVFCTDPSEKYTQSPSEEKVVNISAGDQSVEIIMDAVPPNGGDGKWILAGIVVVGAIGAYFLMKQK